MHQPDKFNTTNLALLLVLGILERFIYYGFRSFFILYLVSDKSGLSLPDDLAGEKYGLMMTVITISLLLSGPIVDFVIPKKLNLPISFFLIGTGILFCLSANNALLTTGIIMMGIGSALNRISFFVRLDHIVQHIPKRRDFVFVLYFTLSLFFIFLAPLVIGSLTDVFEYRPVIQLMAFLTLIPFVLSFSVKSSFTTNKRENQNLLKVRQGIGLAGLAIFLSFTFWLTFDWHYNSLITQVMSSFNTDSSIIPGFSLSVFYSLNGIFAMIPGILLTILLWFFPKIRGLRIVVLSTLLLVISCSLIYLTSPLYVSDQGDISLMVLILFLLGTSEMAITPLLQSFVLKSIPEKLKGTLFSVFLAANSAVFLISFVLEDFVDHEFIILLTSLPVLFVATAMLYADRQIRRRNTNPVFPPQYPQE